MVTAKDSVRINFQVLINGYYIFLFWLSKNQIEGLTMLFHAFWDFNRWPFILIDIHCFIYSLHRRYTDFFARYICIWCLLGGCVLGQHMRIYHRLLLFHDHDFGSYILALALNQSYFILIWGCDLLDHFVFENRYLFLTLNVIYWSLWATLIQVLLCIQR